MPTVEEFLSAIGPEACHQLLTHLRATSSTRAATIGILYQREATRDLAELLIELELDPRARHATIHQLQNDQ
jgi:hypothetical protein